MASIVVGVTGKYCSGKSLVAKNLNLSGSVEIDVDFLGHKALNNCKEEITNRFGDKVLIDNKIDRRILSSVVFSDSSALRDLEGIVHPEMVSMVEKCIADTAGVVVIHAALLYRMKLDLLCDLIVWVEAPFIIRFLRGLKRNSCQWLKVIRIMRAQYDVIKSGGNSTKPVLEINNTGNVNNLIINVKNIVKSHPTLKKH